MPTVSCIVSLVDWPPFILSLQNVELAYLERVSFSLKNFDLVFVFKVSSRPYTRSCRQSRSMCYPNFLASSFSYMWRRISSRRLQKAYLGAVSRLSLLKSWTL
mmetsp:Transcript_38800/g.153251  ORF Transcript_38800/g.153251 Transcript_38800/m.153251 type:complete len:103 (+) Transcript_38800:2943-3251(+)